MITGNIWVVYKHISPSGKVYIGITSNIKRRWEGKGKAYKACNKFYNAIQKYGWDNIKHEILYTDLSEQEAKAKEIELISYYKACNISYNITDGGDGTLGRKMTEKHKALLRKIHTGNTYSLGRVQSKEEKMKKGDKIRGLKRSADTRKRLSDSSKKKVYRYNLEGDFIDAWDSALDAQNALNIPRAKIGACCLGKLKTSGGFRWSFHKEVLPSIIINKASRRICREDIEDNSVKIYKSIAEACKDSCITYYMLIKCCKTSKIYKNKYKFNYETD